MARLPIDGRQANRHDALSRANEIRRARAELKRRIATGDTSAIEVLLHPTHETTTWPLSELLLSQRSWGRVKCRRFLTQNQLDERTRLGELTERQRVTLAMLLGASGGTKPRTARPPDD